MKKNNKSLLNFKLIRVLIAFIEFNTNMYFKINNYIEKMKIKYILFLLLKFWLWTNISNIKI
jgi:hypothetical protein